ncbi:effector-associated constant component EACC1 [Kribbella sp. CA-245084]|uniref:effector-associated constant component EACC1 n=1 Tax=Kribbella sp. CA-245084 TaxID=3239940 RepID=UPI003D8A3093
MSRRFDVEVSDQAELRALREWLQAAGPGVQVVQQASVPEAGQQGALDYLSVLAGSAGLVAAIRVLPEYLRSRRSTITLRVKMKGQDFSITAENVTDVMPVLERLVDAD